MRLLKSVLVASLLLVCGITNAQSVKSLKVKVSFYSIGTGTNMEAQRKFQDFIKTFQEEKKVTLAITSFPWGMEGETDYCINIQPLKKSIKKKLINKLKKLLELEANVRITENEDCGTATK